MNTNTSETKTSRFTLTHVLLSIIALFLLICIILLLQLLGAQKQSSVYTSGQINVPTPAPQTWKTLDKAGSSLNDIQDRYATSVNIKNEKKLFTAVNVEDALTELAEKQPVIEQQVSNNTTVVNKLNIDGLTPHGVVYTDGSGALKNSGNITSDGSYLNVNATLNVKNKLYVDSTGNVGINTPNPTAALHLTGAQLITDGSITLDGATNGTFPSITLKAKPTPCCGGYTYSSISFLRDDGSSIYFLDDNQIGNNGLAIWRYDTTNGWLNMGMFYKNGSIILGDIWGDPNATPQIVMKANSNLTGLVAAQYGSGNYFQAKDFTVDNGGKVGVKTTTPQSELQVNGYLQLGLTSGTPPSTDCNASSKYGRMKFDSATNLLWICGASGWISK